MQTKIVPTAEELELIRLTRANKRAAELEKKTQELRGKISDLLKDAWGENEQKKEQETIFAFARASITNPDMKKAFFELCQAEYDYFDLMHTEF